MAAHDKTEKATPKRRGELRRKGSVARSQELNSAVVLAASLFSLSLLGPKVASRMEAAITDTLALIRTPGVVDRQGVSAIVFDAGRSVLVAAAPLVLVCMVAGVVMSVLQVGFKPSFAAI